LAERAKTASKIAVSVRTARDSRLDARSRKATLSRNEYFYALHRNADGRETSARKYRNKEVALIALPTEVGESLQFTADGLRSSSHSLKRFANVADRPGELLETFLATTEDWVSTDWLPQRVETVKLRKRK
jgi:hypothetical protein